MECASSGLPGNRDVTFPLRESGGTKESETAQIRVALRIKFPIEDQDPGRKWIGSNVDLFSTGFAIHAQCFTVYAPQKKKMVTLEIIRNLQRSSRKLLLT
jgi:hypothetical protein